MELTTSQIKAISHGHGPGLVLAVPGAGKTTVLVHRARKLIRETGKPESILSITFSKTQALDLQKRFDELNKNEILKSPIFSTIHAFAYSIINLYLKKTKKNFTIIEGRDKLNKYHIVRRLYFQLNNSHISEDDLDNFFLINGYLQNSMESLEKYQRNNKIEIKNFEPLLQSFQNFKRTNHMIDFDDMLSFCYHLLLEDVSMRRSCQRRFQYVQVDEGQDTSNIQNEIIKLICQPKNNLFIVADDDQSIYRFRGASPEYLLNFKEIYPQAQVYYMEENHRSTRDIVQASDKFISRNTQRYEKRIRPTVEESTPLSLIRARNIHSQYSYILKRLHSLDPNSSAAVLYRNNISSIGIMNACFQNNINFYIKDNSTSFYNHWIVRDVLNMLEFISDQSNEIIFKDIYYKLNAYIKKEQVLDLFSHPVRENIFDRLLEQVGLNDYYKSKFVDLKWQFHHLKQLKLSEAISFLYTEIGYGEYIKEKSRKEGNTYVPLEKIVETLMEISKDLHSSEELKMRIKELRSAQKQHSKNVARLTLSTIHSSKGLEFDEVFVIDLVDGEFPSAASIEDESFDDVALTEEERRLFYVAMTRAKKKLHLLTLKTRLSKPVEPSQFYLNIKHPQKKSKPPA